MRNTVSQRSIRQEHAGGTIVGSGVKERLTASKWARKYQKRIRDGLHGAKVGPQVERTVMKRSKGLNSERGRGERNVD